MCVCCTEDKKGGVDRSSTVIAKEPEGKTNFRDEIYTYNVSIVHYFVNVARLHWPLPSVVN